jgi:transcriptional regulator with XRE-family HTH domain
MKLGDRVAKLRGEKGWSQQELGDRIGINQRHISRWETFKSMPSAEALMKLSNVFNVSVDYLLFDELPRMTKGQVQDPQFFKKLLEMAELDDSERDVIKKVIEAMLAKKKLNNLVKNRI